jgi:hypothetical protein
VEFFPLKNREDKQENLKKNKKIKKVKRVKKQWDDPSIFFTAKQMLISRDKDVISN